MKTLKTVLHAVSAGLLLAVACSCAAQQAYPAKPIRFIIPYPPGGSSTPLARVFAQKLTEAWGQQVIVDNRGGGNTVIGSELLVKSPPDGYTIMMASPSLVINPSLITTSYDALRDFAPVASLVGSPIVLGAHPSVPANTVQELIVLAKSRPGELNFVSGTSGGLPHLSGELFNIVAAVKLQHVPYKGGGQALTDLLGGQVQLFFFTPFILPQINSGKLKGIAVTGKTRLRGLPQVPTFSEAGLPGYDVNNWYGVVAPAGTPKAIIDKLSSEFARMLAMADVKEQLERFGVDPFISSAEEYGALIKADVAKWRSVVRTARIKLEE